MKGATLIQQVAVCLAVVGFCIPQIAFATAPQANLGPVMTDVQLRDDGLLLGQVVTPENTPVARVDVLLRSGTQEMGASKTDNNGYFTFRGLRTGVYQVAMAEGQATYRVWAKGTAPPGTPLGALIVSGDGMVRGQNGMQGVRNFLTNPWVIAGLIATAVAVPVAIHNAKKPGS